MGWVTMIGPSDEQVEYRLTGGHGCGKFVAVDAAPLIAAIEAKAEAAGAPVASLLANREAKRAFYRARGLLRSKGTARFTGFDAVEVAAAAGLDARDLYGQQALPARSADGQVDYHLDASERPLVWIGGGLSEFDIVPGSVLTPEQFPAARRLMLGEDPRTGQTLVDPKLAIAPAAKLPAAPLARAIRRAAAERSVNPAYLLDSKRKQDAFRRMESQLKRFGETHRVPVSTVLKLADAVGIDAVDLYGEDTVEKAVAAEAGGHLDARALLRAVEARATETGQQPTDLFDAASMKRRYAQTEGEGARRLRDLPMNVREAVASQGRRAHARGRVGRRGDQGRAPRRPRASRQPWCRRHLGLGEVEVRVPRVRARGDCRPGRGHLHGSRPGVHRCAGAVDRVRDARPPRRR